MPQEQVEEYLETVYNIGGKDGIVRTTEIAKSLHVSPASVTESLQNLARKRLVDYEPYLGARLTDRGLDLVEKLKRKHRLLEEFISDVLHIDKEKVHAEACRMEHCISDDVADALCKMLKAPSRCPHGSLIGPCGKAVETCEQCEATASGKAGSSSRTSKIVPITELEPNQEGTIAFLRGDRRTVQRLADLGLTLKTRVRLIRRAPLNGPVEVSVRRTRLAIAGNIADDVFVVRAEA